MNERSEERFMCPLIDDEIRFDDCDENQLYADGLFKPDFLPEKYKSKRDWREICLRCPRHYNDE